jgi:hypothetical protein
LPDKQKSPEIETLFLCRNDINAFDDSVRALAPNLNLFTLLKELSNKMNNFWKGFEKNVTVFHFF